MLEYLGRSPGDTWAGQLHYAIDALRNSPFFWPAIVAVAVIIVVVAKQLSK